MYFVVKVNGLKKLPKNELSYCSGDCHMRSENGKLSCDCGNDIKIFEWYWKKENSQSNILLETDNLEVMLNPVYSSGTAVIRGSEPFEENMHYYWEIKIISNLYGTDVMVGLGTDKIPNFLSRFCSLLGSDDQSWGFSYHGFIQHNKLTRQYGSGFGLGCLIGMHLDMCTGKLEYYLNRKPLGLAFDGLKNKKLYPMACSTAARSAIKLNCAVSNEETLQMLCLKCVQQHPQLFETYSSIPGLYNYYRKKYFWMVPREVKEVKTRDEEEDDLHLMALKCSSSNTSQDDTEVETQDKEDDLHLMAFKCSSSQNGGKKRVSNYFLPRLVKVSRGDTESDNTIRTSRNTNTSNECDGAKDLECNDICKMLYDNLSDSDSQVSCDSDAV